MELSKPPQKWWQMFQWHLHQAIFTEDRNSLFSFDTRLGYRLTNTPTNTRARTIKLSISRTLFPSFTQIVVPMQDIFRRSETESRWRVVQLKIIIPCRPETQSHAVQTKEKCKSWHTNRIQIGHACCYWGSKKKKKKSIQIHTIWLAIIIKTHNK